MKPSRMYRLRRVFLTRLGRTRQLMRMTSELIFSGRISLLYAMIARRLSRAREKTLPVEYIRPEAAPQLPYAHKSASDNRSTPVQLELGETPLVSIIIPCFNYGRFLRRAIDSILSQTLAEIEIIVVEGGSTDGETPGIVRSLDSPKTRVLIQRQPSLVGENRNAGIALARGKFICCLDADDTLEETYLEKAVYLLENHFYDIVSTGICLTGASTGTISVLETPDLRDMTRGNHITTCAVFRRELWEKTGGYFDTGKGKDHVAEDWDFWLRCVATGARVRNITGEYLFNYTVHDGGSLSSTDVRSVGLQRKAILARNQAVITPASLQQSRFQTRRRLVRTQVKESPALPVPSRGRSLLVVVPLMIVGGAEKLLSSVVRHLTAEGWSVTVVSTLQQSGLEDASSWFKDATKEVYSLPRFLREWEYASFLHYLIRSRRYDVTLLAGSRLFYELLPELTSSYPEMAVVDLLFNTVGHVHSHIEFQHYLTYALAENPEVISWYQKLGWRKDRIRLVESGVDVNTFNVERSPALVKELALNADEIVVGYSGRLSDEKAPDVFLELAAAFRGDASLQFVMTGGGPLQDYVEAKIKKMPVGSNFQFKGLVDSTRDYFSTYDIFVLPSRLDGRPIALLEALSSGCAVVASRVGGIPALVEGSGAAFLCTPAHTPDFISAVRSLTSDRAKLAAMKSAARNLATRAFSASQMGADYMAALEAAIEIKRANGLGKK